MNTADPAIDIAPSTAWPNRFHALGEVFFTPLRAEPLPDPHWVATSDDCAKVLGLPPDWSTRAHWHTLDVLSGNCVWPGMVPLASVYSGHQFGA